MCTSSNTFSCFSFQVHYSLCHKLSFTSLISIHASKLISTITSSQKPTQVCPLREYVHRSLRFPWATGHISATTTCSVALQLLITLICSPHWEQKEGREHVLISVVPSSTVVFSTQHSIKVRLKIQANEQINKGVNASLPSGWPDPRPVFALCLERQTLPLTLTTLPLTLTVPFTQSLQSGAGTTPSPSHFLPSHRECFVLFCYQLLSCVTW